MMNHIRRQLRRDTTNPSERLFVTLDNYQVAPSASFHEEQRVHGKECIAAKRGGKFRFHLCKTPFLTMKTSLCKAWKIFAPQPLVKLSSISLSWNVYTQSGQKEHLRGSGKTKIMFNYCSLAATIWNARAPDMKWLHGHKKSPFL